MRFGFFKCCKGVFIKTAVISFAVSLFSLISSDHCVIRGVPVFRHPFVILLLYAGFFVMKNSVDISSSFFLIRFPTLSKFRAYYFSRMSVFGLVYLSEFSVLSYTVSVITNFTGLYRFHPGNFLITDIGAGVRFFFIMTVNFAILNLIGIVFCHKARNGVISGICFSAVIICLGLSYVLPETDAFNFLFYASLNADASSPLVMTLVYMIAFSSVFIAALRDTKSVLKNEIRQTA